MHAHPTNPNGTAPRYDIGDLKNRGVEFARQLRETKEKLKPYDGFWFPYDTMMNLWNLDDLLIGKYRDLANLFGDLPVADIGAADGDLAFFLESLGIRCQIIDHAVPSYNNLLGARLLKENLGSSVEIYDIDLDSHSALPNERYGLILFLNILYHLKNPYHVLETLAKHANYCVISTRITQHLTARQTVSSQHSWKERIRKFLILWKAPHLFEKINVTYVDHAPIAYLLDAGECNNDPTNYWIFTETGLQRLLSRTGWEIIRLIRVGNLNYSDPFTIEGDERAVCLVKSCVRSDL